MSGKFLLAQKLNLHLSSHLVLSGRVLQLSDADLEQFLACEAQTNPVLCFQPIITLDDADSFESVAAQETDLDALIVQARLMLRGDDADIGETFLQSLDERGLLDVSLAELADQLGLCVGDLMRVVAILRQHLLPGLGARDLRECLLLQCETLATETERVRTILTYAWPEVSLGQWDQVARIVRASPQDIARARDAIRNDLRPFPFFGLANIRERSPAVQRVQPDIIVHLNACDTSHATIPFEIEIPAQTRYALRLQPNIATAEGKQNALCPFTERARQIIHALDQRWATLRRLAEWVAQRQLAFFQHGLRHLQPMTRVEAACALGLHESTISRAVCDKILQLPNRQLMLFGDLFDGSLAAKDAIREILSTSSSSPFSRRLSDGAIAEQLHQQGFHLARRTINKYRNQL